MAYNRPSIVAITALIIAILLIFAVVILYVIYFVNTDNTNYFGTIWDYVTVSDTTTTIKPHGNQILSINGAANRNGNDFIYITNPTGIPYVNRIFAIYNNSNSSQLEIRSDSLNFQNGSNGNFFIQPQASTIFLWQAKETLLPLLTAPANGTQ